MLSSRSILSISIASLLAVDVAIGGCGSSSFTGEPVDGGSGDSSTTDAQSSDGSSGDAASNADGAPFCLGLSGTPYFCADFDEGDLVTAYVGSKKSSVFGQAGFDGGVAELAPSNLSLPSLLSSSIPALPASTSSGAQIRAIGLPDTSDGTGNVSVTFHLEFDFRLDAIDTVDSNTRIQVFEIDLTNGALSPDPYRLDFMSGDIVVNVDGAADLNFGTLPAIGDWVHVQFEIVTGGDFQAIVGGSAPQSFPSGAGLLMTKPTFAVGLTSPGGSPAVQVSIENIKLNAHLPDGGLAVGDAG